MIQCPHCNYPVQEGDVYCGNCGHALGADTSSTIQSHSPVDKVFAPLWRYFHSHYGESRSQVRAFTVIVIAISLCTTAIHGSWMLYLLGTDPAGGSLIYEMGAMGAVSLVAALLYFLLTMSCIYGSGRLVQVLKKLICLIAALVIMGAVAYVLPSDSGRMLFLLAWVVISIVANRRKFGELWRHKEYVVPYIICSIIEHVIMVLAAALFIVGAVYGIVTENLSLILFALSLVAVAASVIVPGLVMWRFFLWDMRSKKIDFSKSLHNTVYFMLLLAYAFLVPVEIIGLWREKLCDSKAFC